MNVPKTRSFPFLLLVATLLWLPGTFAQENAPPDNGPVVQTITTEQLRALQLDLRETQTRVAPMLEEIDRSSADEWLEASLIDGLAERAEASAERPPEQALWQAALEHESAAAERLRGALERAALALAAEERLELIAQQIDRMLATPAVASHPGSAERSLTQIEEEIAAVDRRRSQIALERDQKTQIIARLEEQQRTQAATREQLLQSPEAMLEAPVTLTPLVDATLSDAFDAYLLAQDRRASARMMSAQLDQATLRPRVEVLRIEIRALEAEELWLAERQRRLGVDLAERSGEELRALRGEIRRLIERDPDTAKRFQAETEVLLERINEIASTQARVRELQERREQYTHTLEDLEQTLESVTARLEIGGLTDTLGGLLVEEERRLRRMADLELALRAIERELTQSRLRDITLREELRSLSVSEVVVADDPSTATLQRLKRSVIEMQMQVDSQLTEQLLQVETPLRAVVQQVDELARILRESLLWWPSHPPVNKEWFMRLPAALLSMMDRDAWREIGLALAQITIGSPVVFMLTVMIAALLVAWGRQAPTHLAGLAEKTRHRYSDRIGLTFQATGWSLLRALPMPVLLAITGYRLRGISEVGSGVEIISAVLFSVSVWWLAGHLFLLFSSRSGIGTAHFEWNPMTLRRMRHHLAWYLPAQLLVIMFMALAFGHPSDMVADTFGRSGLLATVVLTGLFAWRMLAPPRGAELTPAADRRRRLVRMAFAAFALALIGLTLGGYLLTVAELMQRTINTVVVVGATWLGYSLAARALVLSETRLVLQRMREQRAKAAALAGSSQVGEGAVIDVPEPHLSVENINIQTRTLLRVTSGAVLVLALFWVWADILPALTWLERVTLWSRTIAVGETEILSRVSLQDFLLAGFLGVLFTLAARNLPGLVEILLSRSTQMDAAGRYTVTTLLRYALAVVAVISVFSLLGLRWSELQWMVAALTLGLGFGLQEVVANFVSGIIMLFERPVRVGDTITIGEYSGTVTKIRTRATTIVDWDNREIVVPNKAFITERLINWTLSDTMTRVVIPVGVSYDADVEDVMTTLRAIAESQPTVLKEPPPNVLFLDFADSALSFELRVYVSQMKDRLATISDLHRTIIKEFRKRGIEIAYPQMDLHIRDVAPIKRAEARAGEDAANAAGSRPAG